MFPPLIISINNIKTLTDTKDSKRQAISTLKTLPKQKINPEHTPNHNYIIYKDITNRYANTDTINIFLIISTKLALLETICDIGCD